MISGQQSLQQVYLRLAPRLASVFQLSLSKRSSVFNPHKTTVLGEHRPVWERERLVRITSRGVEIIMGKAMSNDTSTIIVRALAQGHSRNDIAKMCGVSTRAVTRVSTNLKKHGMPRPPPSGLKQGRPAKLTRNQADVCENAICSNS